MGHLLTLRGLKGDSEASSSGAAVIPVKRRVQQ